MANIVFRDLMLIVVRNLDAITFRASTFIYIASIMAGLVYRFCDSQTLKVFIYGLTGWLFWKAFYGAIAFVTGVFATMFSLINRSRGKPYSFTNDKLELLYAIQQDKAVSWIDQVLVVLFAVSFLFFSISLMALFGLFTAKHFLM